MVLYCGKFEETSRVSVKKCKYGKTTKNPQTRLLHLPNHTAKRQKKW